MKNKKIKIEKSDPSKRQKMSDEELRIMMKARRNSRPHNNKSKKYKEKYQED